jgi:hypothetical protein
MSIALRGNIDDINKKFAARGIRRVYSFTDTNGVNLHVTTDGCLSVIGEGYGNLADAIGDLYLDAFNAMAQWTNTLKAALENPLPSKVVYEIISDLVDVACDGVDARKEDEDGLDDRLNTQAGQHAVERGRIILDQYSDAYNGGDLK